VDDIVVGIYEAWNLIISFDSELYGIIGLTLVVTIMSTLISSLIGVPLGLAAGSSDFKGKKILFRVVHTLMGLPPVVAGLLVFLTLSRRGPLGSLMLLFTPTAMIIAQVLIITPIVLGLAEAAVKAKSKAVYETCAGLKLKRLQVLRLLFHECRYPLISIIVAAYGRAVSEVGAVMLVGGNIQHHTRVMTTAIVLETGKGNFETSLALGIILLTISFLINSFIWKFQEVP
jgi:tungstate transport system permease protein